MPCRWVDGMAVGLWTRLSVGSAPGSTNVFLCGVEQICWASFTCCLHPCKVL